MISERARRCAAVTLLSALTLATSGARSADRPERCNTWSDQRANPRCVMPAEVMEADRRLNRAWRDLLATTAKEDVALLRSEQRDWLLRRDRSDIDDLKSLYEDRIAYLDQLARRVVAFDPSRREAIFGRYGERTRICLVDGTCPSSGDSTVFVLPTGEPGRARVLVDTLFFNGHSCTLDAVGTFEDGRLILMLDAWNDARKDIVEKSCRVPIRFDPGKSLTIERDADCGASSSYCGARGSLPGDYPRWRAGARSPR